MGPVHKSLYTSRYKRLIKRLVAARSVAGLTQAQVAQKLGRGQSYVSKYESGERRLDVVELIDIADVVAIDVIELLNDLH
ncbi:MAG: helix-turn-helix transcriptional regulator [Candidatus Velthaea sp.]